MSKWCYIKYMTKLELEQLQSFLRGSEKDKETIFLKYLDRFKNDISFKKKHFKRYLDPTEVDTDAVFAIQEMFLEADSYMKNSVERARVKAMSRLNMKAIFNKHLMKFSRENKLANQPLTKVIKCEFSKTKKSSLYTGYEHSLAVFTADGLIDHSYPEDADKDHLEYVKEIMDLVAADIGTNIYKDFTDHFLEGKTLVSIANQRRNKGVSKQEIHRRLKRYIKTINTKLKKEEL